jgi:hypothetical protein
VKTVPALGDALVGFWLLLIPAIGYDVVGERMLGHFIEHDFVEVIELVLESLKKAKEI